MILDEIKALLATGNTAEQHLVELDRKLEVRIRKLREERAAGDKPQALTADNVKSLDTKLAPMASDARSGRSAGARQTQPRGSDGFKKT